MNGDRRMTGLVAVLLCIVAGALAFAGLRDGDETRLAGAGGAAAASEPLVIELKPAHDSGVHGTATLVQAGANMTVTLKLSERVPGSLLAHVHTGPCSKEPTLRNPRIWVNLTEAIGGRSETTANVATLQELRSDGASINVHDPEHGNRPLVCGDIARAS